MNLEVLNARGYVVGASCKGDKVIQSDPYVGSDGRTWINIHDRGCPETIQAVLLSNVHLLDDRKLPWVKNAWPKEGMPVIVFVNLDCGYEYVKAKLVRGSWHLDWPYALLKTFIQTDKRIVAWLPLSPPE